MHYLNKPKDTRERWRVERGEIALDTMEKHLSTREWFVGDDMTIADIALFAYSHIADEGGFDLYARPAIQSWIKRCGERINKRQE